MRAPLSNCAGLLALLMLAGCHEGILDPQGPVGSAENSILFGSVVIMLVIIIPTIIAIFVVAWWFRASNPRAFYWPGWAYSGQLELIVWAIPLLVIILLGGVAWIGSHDLDPAMPLASDARNSDSPPLQIQIVSLDWKWLFLYPDQHIASVNRLVVPVGVPLHLSLTSASVMSAFFVPQLGSMIYTMNHMTTQLNLRADRPGDFPGLSSHFNGDGFSDMRFMVQAVSPDQFAAWTAATQNKGPALDPAGYADLARQSVNPSPVTYGKVDPALFQQIVTQILPPAPGPRAP